MNSSDTDFNAVEKTGGSKTHAHSQGSTGGPSNNTSGSTVLTTDQMPSHAHTLHAVNKASNGYNPANDNSAEFELNYNQSITYSYPTKGWCNTVAMGATGGGEGHTHTLSSHTHTNPNTNSASSLDPYITVYFWKRTA